MLCPRRLQRVEPAVQRLQAMYLVGSELVVRDDHEVDVTELVGVAGRERAVQVCPAAVVGQDCSCTRDELTEDGVELRIGGHSPSRPICSGGVPSASTTDRRMASMRSRCSGADSHRFCCCPGSLGRWNR